MNRREVIFEIAVSIPDEGKSQADGIELGIALGLEAEAVKRLAMHAGISVLESEQYVQITKKEKA